MNQNESNGLKSIVRVYQLKQNRENLVTEMIQMDQNQSLKWIEMEQNIPTRVQFTKFNQNRKNLVS